MSLSQRRNRDGGGHASGVGEDLPAPPLRDPDPNEAQNAEAWAMAWLMANRPKPGSPQEMIRYLFLLTRGDPEHQALLDSGPGTRRPPRRSMASDSSRPPIELDAAMAALLEQLSIVTGLDTHHEIFDQALQVFRWVARERAYGARIISIDPDGTFRERNSAVLDVLAEEGRAHRDTATHATVEPARRM